MVHDNALRDNIAPDNTLQCTVPWCRAAEKEQQWPRETGDYDQLCFWEKLLLWQRPKPADEQPSPTDTNISHPATDSETDCNSQQICFLTWTQTRVWLSNNAADLCLQMIPNTIFLAAPASRMQINRPGKESDLWQWATKKLENSCHMNYCPRLLAVRKRSGIDGWLFVEAQRAVNHTCLITWHSPSLFFGKQLFIRLRTEMSFTAIRVYTIPSSHSSLTFLFILILSSTGDL